MCFDLGISVFGKHTIRIDDKLFDQEGHHLIFLISLKKKGKKGCCFRFILERQEQASFCRRCRYLLLCSRDFFMR